MRSRLPLIIEPGTGRRDRLVQLRLQRLTRRQHGQVLGNVDTAFAEFQQFDLLLLLAGAEDDADWRCFTRFQFVLRKPSKVQFHLTLVLSFEGAEFQLDGDETLEFAVVEQQIQIEVVVIDRQPFPAGHERKACAEFQQELLHFAQDRIFQIALQVVIIQSEEVEHVRILQHELGRDLLRVAKVGEFEVVCLPAGPSPSQDSMSPARG